ncbi:MAG: hypothetical protein V4592_11625 [Bacteroidota bacterium]
MRHTVAIAVAGGILINTLGIYKQDKKNDVFSKADSKYKNEKKCNATAKNNRCKNWRACPAV